MREASQFTLSQSSCGLMDGICMTYTMNILCLTVSMKNIPYGQSCAKLPVILSPSHLVIWSLGHLVTWSLGHLVTWSLSHSVTRSLNHSVTRSTYATDTLTNNIRIYRSASQTNTTLMEASRYITWTVLFRISIRRTVVFQIAGVRTRSHHHYLCVTCHNCHMSHSGTLCTRLAISNV